MARAYYKGFDPEVRFWLKVDIKKPEECWAWLGYTQKKAKKEYGDFRVNKKTIRSHRMAWIVTFGDIPPGLSVLHKCDNPKCCNPHHLFIGTSALNTSDMVSKNRQCKGEQSRFSKLTEKQVLEIRELEEDCRKSKGLRQSVAAGYNVSRSCLEHIWRGSTWKHLI